MWRFWYSVIVTPVWYLFKVTGTVAYFSNHVNPPQHYWITIMNGLNSWYVSHYLTLQDKIPTRRQIAFVLGRKQHVGIWEVYWGPVTPSRIQFQYICWNYLKYHWNQCQRIHPSLRLWRTAQKIRVRVRDRNQNSRWFCLPCHFNDRLSYRFWAWVEGESTTAPCRPLLS